MRWAGQAVGVDDGALPGLQRIGFVRSVRAPQFAGITFHEVLCKSALNKVPDAAALPFRYTVNGYRGCSHACRYCFARPTHEYLVKTTSPRCCAESCAGRRGGGRPSRWVPTPIPTSVRRAATPWLVHVPARSHPELVGRYRELYRRGAYLPPAYREMLRGRAAPLIAKHRLAGDHRPFPSGAEAVAAPEPVQQTLF